MIEVLSSVVLFEIAEAGKKSRFEDELREEQEAKRREEEEREKRKLAFKEKAKLFGH